VGRTLTRAVTRNTQLTWADIGLKGRPGGERAF
jgi:hypothetical protein